MTCARSESVVPAERTEKKMFQKVRILNLWENLNVRTRIRPKTNVSRGNGKTIACFKQNHSDAMVLYKTAYVDAHAPWRCRVIRLFPGGHDGLGARGRPGLPHLQLGVRARVLRAPTFWALWFVNF